MEKHNILDSIFFCILTYEVGFHVPDESNSPTNGNCNFEISILGESNLWTSPQLYLSSSKYFRNRNRWYYFNITTNKNIGIAIKSKFTVDNCRNALFLDGSSITDYYYDNSQVIYSENSHSNNQCIDFWLFLNQ